MQHLRVILSHENDIMISKGNFSQLMTLSIPSEYKHIHNKMLEAAHIGIITICLSTCNNAASAQLCFVKSIQKKSLHKSVQPYLFVTLSLSISTYLHHILMKFHLQLFDGYLQ